VLKLDATSLDWALTHCLNYGDTDVFPRPFEYEALEFDWDRIRQYLASENVIKWSVRPHRSVLSAKAKYGFRVVTQLDPLDFLLFAALVRELAHEIEARRVPRDRCIVFSYRAGPRSG